MDHATAKAIAAEYAPDLHIDDINPDIPMALVVRRKKDSAPFNIAVPVALEDGIEDIPGRDAVPEQPAIPATADHPGRPAIPGQPAVQARTKAGLLAEMERSSLISALDAAKVNLR